VRLVASAAIWLVLLPCAGYALAQNAPVSPDHPWHPATALRIEADVKDLPTARVKTDPARTYSRRDGPGSVTLSRACTIPEEPAIDS
jgi:hypothetical protein